MAASPPSGDPRAHLATFARFPLALRRFLGPPLALEEAQAIVRGRLAGRVEYFRQLLNRSVYERPQSPYLALLTYARCERGDVHALIDRHGVEGTLTTLRAAGVYVTFEEFKGRRPIVRGSLEVPVTPRDFDNPSAHGDLVLTTGGSTGAANAVYQDLDHIADLAVDEMVALAAHGVLDAPTIHWSQILPSSGIRFVLQRARHGDRAQHWVTPAGWRDSRHWLKYGLATLYMLAWARLFGLRAGPPRVVRPEDAALVARAMRETIDRRGRCVLYSTVSQAVRVSIAAKDGGFDLAGATVRLASEPLTPLKRRQIEEAGARILAGYGSIETGAIGLGCLSPAAADDVHLLTDAFALISHPHEVAGAGPVAAFNLTGLRRTAPKVMLNYQVDDCGIVDTRACGCPLEAFGTTHLHTIRSYSKLVGEGVTLLGSELLPLMEEALPARFGGNPLDYQIVEREDVRGLTKLVLVVSPRVAIEDEGRVVEFVLERLRAGSPAADAARVMWDRARTLQVERAEPTLTARGKFSPLHVERRAAAPPDVTRPARRSRF